jgi:hypothetical protein
MKSELKSDLESNDRRKLLKGTLGAGVLALGVTTLPQCLTVLLPGQCAQAARISWTRGRWIPFIPMAFM